MSDSVDSYPFLSSPKQHGDLGALAHYRVIRELGHGGMGFVFEAEDAKLKRPVALKVMNQKISAAPGSRKRFISEARAMAAVHHDNVATIFEVGESGGTPFMAMEMLHGQTLEDFNRGNKKNRKDVKFDEVIRYSSEIARGLAAAHARGIVHRDIKPANIWLERETNRIKILDFGLALASTPIDQLAGRGAVIGTPGYLSPEQARSDPLDDRSDLYSLGVVLYELCTGKLPIISKSVPEQLISILAHRPRPIYELNPDIPRPLCDAIHKLIRKEPRTRYQSARSFEESLVEVREACEKTTEVAQAINKLKEGLSQVTEQSNAAVFDPGFSEAQSLLEAQAVPVQVGINGDPSFASLDEINVPVVDPLAMDPLGTPVSTGANSGAMRTVVRRPQGATSEKTPLQRFGPLIGVVALLLLSLPVMTFAFSGFGRSDAAFLIEPRSGKVQSPNPNDEPDRSKQNKGDLQSANPTGSASNRNSKSGGQTSKKKWQKGQGKGKKRGKRKNGKEEVAKTQDADGQEILKLDGVGMSIPQKDAKAVDSAKKLSGADEMGSQPEMDPRHDISDLNPENQESGGGSLIREKEEPGQTEAKTEIARKVIWISTADGRGADAMVKAGSTENFGENPAIGVRRRGKVEINHIYLRFDLEQVSDRAETIKDSVLAMNVVGGKTPIGAELRIFGIADAGLWHEKSLEWRKSPSWKDAQRGLSQLEPLVELVVEDHSGPGQRPGVIQIQGDRLDQFLQQASETATFAVTGSWNNQLLQFVSRERRGGAPPRLKLNVAEESSAKRNKKRKRR